MKQNIALFQSILYCLRIFQKSEKSMYFSLAEIEMLQSEYAEIRDRYNVFLIELGALFFNNKEAKDFAYQGFARRIGIIRRCIENVYRICPPNIDHKPNSERLTDLNINLQAFILNVYGSLDNLAWVWVKEKNIVGKDNQPLLKQHIGFSAKYHIVRKSFSSKFQEYLKTRDPWFDNLENFRHALAHRIPLYVPPRKLTTDEQQKWRELEVQRQVVALQKDETDKYEQLTNETEMLGTFIPAMTHSYTEQAPMLAFHPQIVVDWKTVMEIWGYFLNEMESCETQQLNVS